MIFMVGDILYFNPRSPYGERPVCVARPVEGAGISIHAPLTGSDDTVLIMLYSGWNFNPRSPYGERLRLPLLLNLLRYFNPRSPYGERLCASTELYSIKTISIHAPLTGSDLTSRGTIRRPINFNPRSPYGERPLCCFSFKFAGNFNPRSPYGERLNKRSDINANANFNPRSPYGERPGRHTMRMPPCVFQSTLPLRGATVMDYGIKPPY